MSIGTIIAVIVLALCIVALAFHQAANAELVIGLIAGLAVAILLLAFPINRPS